MASIKSYTTKCGEKRYEIQMYAGINEQTGKPKKIHRKGFKTKREANLAISRLTVNVNEGNVKKENNILFKDVYEQWYQTYINSGVRTSTYARTHGMFKNHILPAFGNLRIRTITTPQIQKVVNEWFKLAPASGCKRWYYYTQNVFDYALTQKYMTGDNPVKAAILPHRQAQLNDDDKFYDMEQIKAFFKCIDPTVELEKYTLFRLLCFSGIRRGECLALTWNDIDFETAQLSVNKTLTQGMRGETIVQPPKTDAGNRVIALDDETMAYLKKWRALQKVQFLELGFNTMSGKQLIFANRKNGYKSLDTPRKWQTKIIDDNHLSKLKVHGWRHTNCYLLFSIGASVKEVQQRLGHDDANTTLSIYAHVTQHQDMEVVQKLGKVVNV